MRIPAPLRIALLIGMAVRCNTTEDLPQRPSPVNVAPISVVVVPVPIPSPGIFRGAGSYAATCFPAWF